MKACVMHGMHGRTAHPPCLHCQAATLTAACEATLLFHSGSPWDVEKAAAWQRLTGGPDATTKALCDFIRSALEANR